MCTVQAKARERERERERERDKSDHCALIKEFADKIRDSANAVPTNRNYTTELSTFGIIAGVNPAEVQWSGLALGPPPT